MKHFVGPVATGAGRKPRLKLPAKACECHSHVYDRRYPMVAGRTVRHYAPLSAYKALLARLGFERTALAHSSTYGADNSCTLDAIRELGIERARGTAVPPPDATAADLRRLHAAGIRGFRFSYGGDEFSPGDAKAVARRIAPLGWHLQVAVWRSEAAAFFQGLASDVVIDHVGRIDAAGGVNNPHFVSLLRFLDSGQGWVKISGPYYASFAGPPGYADFGERVKALVGVRPDRLVWGANWPHPTLPKEGEPEEADWLDAMADWMPDETMRNAIFVDNPARLYGFTA